MIFRYDGIPVAYNRQNVKLLSRVGNILAAQSCVHFDVETDFIVFKPSVGSILKVNHFGTPSYMCCPAV